MPLTPKALLFILLALLLGAGVLVVMGVTKKDGPTVVVYTSVDAEAALPLFEKFTKETGIAVVPRTDSEAAKTTGMALRLMQMKDQPDGDVFWNSEQSQTMVLAANGVLQPYASPSAADIPAGYKHPESLWTGFGSRVRVLIYNTERVKREDVPKTLEALADPRWKGRFTIAKPLYGTTRSHLVGLAVALGDERAFKLFRAWRENGLVLAASNGDVRNRVADGTFDLGLTDTDDVYSAMDRHKPVDFTVPDQTAELPGAFVIPNTVAMLNNCPHPKEARAFIDYLLKPETEAWLSGQAQRQIPVRPLAVGAAAEKLPEALRPGTLKPVPVDMAKVAEQVLPLGERIQRILTGEEK